MNESSDKKEDVSLEALYFGYAHIKCGICSQKECNGNHPELPMFKDKYPISWCKLCETKRITCLDPNCRGTNCNGGGCNKCHDDTIEYNLTLQKERSKQ